MKKNELEQRVIYLEQKVNELQIKLENLEKSLKEKVTELDCRTTGSIVFGR